MTTPAPASLALSRTALRLLRILNVLGAVAIGSLVLGSFFIPGLMTRVLEGEGVGHQPGLAHALRAIALLGLVAAAAMHIILTRLEAIVETVQDADPFIRANARRLDAVAWAVLGLELLHALIAGVATHVKASGLAIDIEWEFSATRILTALMLFVLARVFDHGARMRADLERTI